VCVCVCVYVCASYSRGRDRDCDCDCDSASLARIRWWAGQGQDGPGWDGTGGLVAGAVRHRASDRDEIQSPISLSNVNLDSRGRG
jgi:hypothetical protein